MTCSRPHNKSAAELGPEGRPQSRLLPRLSPLTVLPSGRTPAPVQSLSHTRARPPNPWQYCCLAALQTAPTPSGSLVPSTCSLKTASPELGPHLPPACSGQLPWQGAWVAGAGTSFPVFLSDRSRPLQISPGRYLPLLGCHNKHGIKC